MEDLAIESPATLTDQTARRALTVACQRVGLPSDRAELIRLGSNAVYRLDPETIARIAPSAAGQPNATMQIAVSRWLEGVGSPAARATAIAQPVEADGRIVTFWESVAPETVYAPIGQVADLVRRLHELPPPPPSVKVPELRPFGAPDDPLLASGVDLRTVAGRLGHGSGEATTRKVYAAWSLAPISRRPSCSLPGSRTPRPLN